MENESGGENPTDIDQLLDRVKWPLGVTALAGAMFTLEYHDVINVPPIIEAATQGVAITGVIITGVLAFLHMWKNPRS